jgi:hypothetical protein
MELIRVLNRCRGQQFLYCPDYSFGCYCQEHERWLNTGCQPPIDADGDSSMGNPGRNRYE